MKKLKDIANDDCTFLLVTLFKILITHLLVVPKYSQEGLCLDTYIAAKLILVFVLLRLLQFADYPVWDGNKMGRNIFPVSSI